MGRSAAPTGHGVVTVGGGFGGLAGAWALNRSRSTVALPGMSEHQEHDSDPRSQAYHEKAGAPQPECL
jgi:2-polyprenyl-6-methoxyphenol hydroxylase-like FAD-dependent oxidoreductase